MRVLHLVLTLDVGGLERLVCQMAAAAPGYGLEPHIACLDFAGHLGRRIRQDGVPVTELHRSGPVDLVAIARLSRYCRRHDVRVLHSHSGCMLYAALLGWACPGLRVIHTDHGRHHPEIPLICTEERVACRRVDRIVPVSHALAECLARRVRLPRGKIRVIWNGVDFVEFHPPEAQQRREVRQELGIPPEARVIGTVGRLSPVKNQRLLLAAFAAVLRQRKDAHLLIVGDGPLRQDLTAEAMGLGLDGHVTFAGQRDDVCRMLWAMDAFALSSSSEAMPVTVIEALACGLPCATTGVGDLPRMSEACGRIRIAPAAVPEVMAMAIMASMEDQVAGPREGIAGLFGFGAMMGAYLELYKQS